MTAMFGDEPPEDPHLGQKIVAIIFAVIFLGLALYGLMNGHIITAGMHTAGMRHEGTSAYLISVSFLCLAALCVISLWEWANKQLQKRVGTFLIFAFLIITVVSFFFD